MAAGGCRAGGGDSSALNQMSVPGNCGLSLLDGFNPFRCWDGWLCVALVGPLLGESVQSKPGLVAGSSCPSHLGSVTLLCRKLLCFSLHGTCWFGSFCCCFEPQRSSQDCYLWSVLSIRLGQTKHRTWCPSTLVLPPALQRCSDTGCALLLIPRDLPPLPRPALGTSQTCRVRSCRDAMAGLGRSIT